MFCSRCKRNSHNRSQCRARTFKDGNQIGYGRSGSSYGNKKKWYPGKKKNWY